MSGKEGRFPAPSLSDDRGAARDRCLRMRLDAGGAIVLGEGRPFDEMNIEPWSRQKRTALTFGARSQMKGRLIGAGTSRSGAPVAAPYNAAGANTRPRRRFHKRIRGGVRSRGGRARLPERGASLSIAASCSLRHAPRKADASGRGRCCILSSSIWRTAQSVARTTEAKVAPMMACSRGRSLRWLKPCGSCPIDQTP